MNLESGKIQSFTDLNAWQKGHELVISVYRATKDLPKEEIFGLMSQMRRSAVSVTSNIAEGFTRKSSREKVQFYTMALASLTELQNQLLVCRDVGYISKQMFVRLSEQSVVAHKLIRGLTRGAHSLDS